MNWLWSGILLLIAMFCKVEGDFAHEEYKSKRGNILAIVCILL